MMRLSEKIWPVTAVLSGALTAVLLFQVFHRDELRAVADVRKKFESLPSSEQKLILGRAEALKRIWEQNPAEKERMLNIHRAVTSDPELYDKLKRLYAWWISLDDTQKARLRKDGRFADDWVAAAQDLYIETRYKEPEIRLWPLRISFRESAYVSFLNAALPQPLPEDLQQQLAGFSESEDNCERILVQTLWLYDKVTQPPAEDSTEVPVVTADRVVRAMTDYLITSDVRPVLDEWRQRLERMRNGRSLSAAERDRFLVIGVLRSAIDTYDNIFKQKHVAPDRDDLLAAYLSLPPEQQTELLRRDPDTVVEVLRRRLIEERSQKNKDPAVAALADRLTRFQFRNSPWRSGRNRGGRGPGPGSGRGGGGRPPEFRPPPGEPILFEGRPDDRRPRDRGPGDQQPIDRGPLP